MKELSIEQKAKRYDEILARAVGANLPYYNDAIMSKVKEFVEYLLPELKESEGERTWIINYLSNRILNSTIIAEKENLKKAIAWLEKQGEHANFRNKIQIGDKVTRNEDGVLVNLSQLKRVAKKDKKQGEQKPVEWNEEDDLPEFESYLCLMFQKFRTKGMCTNGEIIDFVEEHSQKLKDTLCHAWSEEDEKKIDSIIETIRIRKFEHPQLTPVYEGDINWLKSLKDKVQPKQEWSEEDRKIIIELIGIFESAIDGGHVAFPYRLIKDYIRVLKSCLSQSTWKPSEEMLEALYRVIPENVMEKSEDEMLLDKLYQGLKYGRVLSEK